MVRRNQNLSFGGSWTFPGGVLEPGDGPVPKVADEQSQQWGEPSLLSTAARGAVRETKEETALTVTLQSLAWFSHWIPPTIGPPKRFSTWFFVAPEHQGEIVVDTSENDEACWISPGDALNASHDGEFPLTVPTWITLDDLRTPMSVASLLDSIVTQGARFHHTRSMSSEQGRVLCWEGDSAYENGIVDTPGPRNRVLASNEGVVIERFKTKS
jgi:8-oxo-dGTP pyrophosphatase MutT (NUDIX family)